MILVLLGTQNNSFHRLLEALQNWIQENKITEDIIVQAGRTKFSSNVMKIVDFLSLEEMNQKIDQARVIITHGGVGSILSGLKKGKKVIAVPRRKEWKEHVNNHQIQIVENFDQQGYIKGVFEIEKLGDVITQIEQFEPKKFISNTNHMIGIIENFIAKNDKK